MKNIEDLFISIEYLYVKCRSDRYTAKTSVENIDIHIKKGSNILYCDIDNYGWAISYYIPMCNYIKSCVVGNKIQNIRDNDAIIGVNNNIFVDNMPIHYSELCKKSCYLDSEMYSLFSSKKTVRALIENGIKKSKSTLLFEQICSLFDLSKDRLDRPINCTGNERFRAMAAVGLSFGKVIFCFPWMSKKSVEYYGWNLKYVLQVLANCGKIVILPTNADDKII